MVVLEAPSGSCNAAMANVVACGMQYGPVLIVRLAWYLTPPGNCGILGMLQQAEVHKEKWVRNVPLGGALNRWITRAIGHNSGDKVR